MLLLHAFFPLLYFYNVSSYSINSVFSVPGRYINCRINHYSITLVCIL